MHPEPDVGFDPGSPGLRPGPKASAKPLHHPGIPLRCFFNPTRELYFLLPNSWRKHEFCLLNPYVYLVEDGTDISLYRRV